MAASVLTFSLQPVGAAVGDNLGSLGTQIISLLTDLSSDSSSVLSKLDSIQQSVDKGNTTTVYYAGTETCTASEEALAALVAKGFVAVGSPRTLLDGSKIRAYMYTNSLGNMNWEVADKTAREFYKEVNDWSIKEGYGAIAVSSRLPSYSESDWIKSCTAWNTNYNWLSTQTYSTNSHFCLMTDGRFNSDTVDGHDSYQCFVAVWVRVS